MMFNALLFTTPGATVYFAADVFCDVGNKSIGIRALMQYLGSTPAETRFSTPNAILNKEERLEKALSTMRKLRKLNSGMKLSRY